MCIKLLGCQIENLTTFNNAILTFRRGIENIDKTVDGYVINSTYYVYAENDYLRIGAPSTPIPLFQRQVAVPVASLTDIFDSLYAYVKTTLSGTYQDA